MSETRISREIRHALEQAGCRVRRVQSGSAYGGKMHLAPTGTPDLHVDCWHGVSGWVEVKRPDGKRRPEQVAFAADSERRGIRHAFVASAREAVEVVQGWRRG